MSQNISEHQESNLLQSYRKLPLTFFPNHGQVGDQIKFYCKDSGCHYAFFTNKVSLTLFGYNDAHELTENQIKSKLTPYQSSQKSTVKGVTLNWRFLNPSNQMILEGKTKDSGTINLIYGNNPKKWLTEIPLFKELLYKNVWQGIDWIWKDDKGELKYDIIVHPHGNIEDIQILCEGMEQIELCADGSLMFHTEYGTFNKRKPIVYQTYNGVRKNITCRYCYTISDGKVIIGYEFPNSYDTNRTLIIDPTLSYSTYLGGSLGDIGESIAVDSQGNAYVTGVTRSMDFPTTQGAFQTMLMGLQSIFVTKFNSTGSALIYSTYLGGNGIDTTNSITVDTQGNAFVTGNTQSMDFPTTVGAFQTMLMGGQSAFVTKLNATGTILDFSTYLGGDGADNGSGIAVDSQGNAFVTGDTSSMNFPTTAGAFQPAFGGGGLDVFVTKLNNIGTNLVYSTYLGGMENDLGTSITIDPQGNAFVTGSTLSMDFPTTPGVFQTMLNGVVNAFITKLNSSGTMLLFSTYLGGSLIDGGVGIVVDSQGNAVVSGTTQSMDFPTTPGAFQTMLMGTQSAFVTKLNSIGNALLFSTYLGGNDVDAARGLAVDQDGNAFVTGVTQSQDFPVTPDALQMMLDGPTDAFVTQLNALGSALLFSTYLGGSGGDDGNGLTLDSQGNVFVSGQTGSTDFPITSGVFQMMLNGLSDAFVTKFQIALPPPPPPPLISKCCQSPCKCKKTISKTSNSATLKGKGIYNLK
ncbi:SBBP repeat-containing protein [Bacillus sp. SM2101]|uniref:SBBP repeat-containing protein n=1 Tax=Bacillus sp. SM2101 TaxID=2805366 RepID=UPI001BDED04D|nr:SBBP repeat-containing protein [Bacillus sp. SM2101]